jgi:anti-anti-sigma regulatory factor
VIDASAVARVDTLGCQLLVSLRHTLNDAGKQNLLQNLSEPLIAGLTELGLHRFFDMDKA